MRTRTIVGCAALTLAWVMAPSAAPAQVDHYLCYKTKDTKNPEFVQLKAKDGNGISLSDQFGTDANVDVKKPRDVCVPVSKNGGSINDANTHLCEYLVKSKVLKFKPPRPVVQISSQFQISRLEIKKASTLLVPCTKTLLP